MHKIWPGRRAHKVKYENISNSDVVGMSLASFCQSRAYETATPRRRIGRLLVQKYMKER